MTKSVYDRSLSASVDQIALNYVETHFNNQQDERRWRDAFVLGTAIMCDADTSDRISLSYWRDFADERMKTVTAYSARIGKLSLAGCHFMVTDAFSSFIKGPGYDLADDEYMFAIVRNYSAKVRYLK